METYPQYRDAQRKEQAEKARLAQDLYESTDRLGPPRGLYDQSEKAPSPYSGTAMVGAVAGRQDAKGALLERISHLRNEAAMLQAVYDVLPHVLPPSADEGIWLLITRQR